MNYCYLSNQVLAFCMLSWFWMIAVIIIVVLKRVKSPSLLLSPTAVELLRTPLFSRTFWKRISDLGSDLEAFLEQFQGRSHSQLYTNIRAVLGHFQSGFYAMPSTISEHLQSSFYSWLAISFKAISEHFSSSFRPAGKSKPSQTIKWTK